MESRAADTYPKNTQVPPPPPPGRKIYLYFNDLNKAKRDVDPNEENKCVMVLLI